MIAEYGWLVPALPALSAVLIIAFGRRLPKGGAEVGIIALAVALALSIGIATEIFSGNVRAVDQALQANEPGEVAHLAAGDLVASDAATALPVVDADEVVVPQGAEAVMVERSFVLAEFGEGSFEAGIRMDGLTAMMLLLVTFVSLMVHLYSASYMKGDPRFTWYFALLSMFTSSMLIMVVGNNLMQVLVGWELVGICSFLLIGFWWEKHKNSSAAIKAFLTTKLGDVGLMVGVIGLWAEFRTFNIAEMTAIVQAGDFSQGLLTFSLIALFIGAVGKSAQFPLHTWLPDAMAGPTPVSALIHAATMVTAGVFIVARLYPLYQAAPAAQATVGIIGAITLFAMGLLALVQDDVKKVLAYSTISQLGYMVAALAFSYTAGIFHLFTHGFFKALLFLGAGSIIHSAHSNNMSDMGGMRKAMPITYATFAIGTLALIAVPPLAGFWSKDEVLAAAFESGGYVGNVVLVLGALGGLVTALYMTRLMIKVFFGEYRGTEHLHESPRLMTGPLIALAIPGALIGLINLPFDWFQPISFSAWTMWSTEYWITHPIELIWGVAIAATALGLIGVAIGVGIYRSQPERDPMLHMGPVTVLLANKWFLDHLYEGVIVKTTRDRVGPALVRFNDAVLDGIVYRAGAATKRFGESLYRVGDQKAIDGVINGIGSSTLWSGAKMKLSQSGNVQLYAGAMFVGVFVLAIVFAAG